MNVSIPFIAGQWSLHKAPPRVDALLLVSIPFIAGQWSLPATTTASVAGALLLSQSPSLRGSGRFDIRLSPNLLARLVSIPFIAGQWSLPASWLALGIRTDTSQSPSLRGSGRFKPDRRACAPLTARLNPLHCGAVVASGGHHDRT